jgi:signal transduction histidine kinase
LKNNAEAKKINVVNDVPASAIVFADEDMIFSVIQNLLSNAIKFTRENGSIVFRAHPRESEIEVSITDNGVGIKEEDIRKLFRIDSHHTTYGTKDEKGSGLGLLLCREMVERNRGKIWVTSKLGEGTTFSFTVPKG